MRWLVTLARRDQTPTFGQTGITETIVSIADIHAAIEPMGLQSFLGSEQMETPITHTIYIRWQPFENLQMFNVVLRNVFLPDNSVIVETYRIRRIQEWQGRHRYIRMDVELEQIT
jgi:hypothetical protein